MGVPVEYPPGWVTRLLEKAKHVVQLTGPSLDRWGWGMGRHEEWLHSGTWRSEIESKKCVAVISHRQSLSPWGVDKSYVSFKNCSSLLP